MFASVTSVGLSVATDVPVGRVMLIESLLACAIAPAEPSRKPIVYVDVEPAPCVLGCTVTFETVVVVVTAYVEEPTGVVSPLVLTLTW